MSETRYTTEQILTNSPFIATEQLGKQLGATLILAPHPDDESLGCGGLIQYLIEQKISVWICFITSGGASHLNSITYPHEVLKQIREQEALSACEILGIPHSQVIFLNEKDGQLSNLRAEEKETIAVRISTILKDFEIESLLLPWRRDPHSDHIATYKLGKIAVEANERKVQLVEYPIWLWKNSKIKDWPKKEEIEIFALDITPVLRKKRMAIFAHKSQTSDLIQDDPHGFYLTEELLAPFLIDKEFYFLPRKSEIPSLEKDYFDTLYENNPDPWNFRHSDYEKSKYKRINTFLEGKLFNQGLELGCSIGEHSSFLASHCKALLAIDINRDAIETARNTHSQLKNVCFEVMNILVDFPTDSFDFISMCEMGYYFNRKDLMHVFEQIYNSLLSNGQFLMVHWMSFVREYPLTGKQVHLLFEEFNKKNHFKLIAKFSHERYELLLWQKQD